MSDDAERLRIVQAAREVPRDDEPGPSVSRFVGRVRSTSPNITVGKFLLVRPEIVTGTESEGQPPTYTDAGSVDRSVLLLGPGKPAPGDHVLVRSADSRLVTKRKSNAGPGGTSGTLLGCTCQHPPITLTMTVLTCADGRFFNTTITYKPVPAGLGALQLGANAYLSDSSFPDPQTGDVFYYFLSCFANVVRISRVFETSIYGSPFLDSVIYFWTLGFPGNTCSPFSLTNGTVFAGGDPNCDVDITG